MGEVVTEVLGSLNPVGLLGEAFKLVHKEAAEAAQKQQEQKEQEVRLRNAFDHFFEGRSIERFPVPFVTATAALVPQGAQANATMAVMKKKKATTAAPPQVRLQLVTRRDVGVAMIGTTGSGFERLQRGTAVELACEAFPNAHLIVIDVARPDALQPRVPCPVTPIAVDISGLPPLAYLGTFTRTLPSGSSPPPGVIVDAVTSGSSAAVAGLKQGDVITGINEVHPKTHTAVNREVQQHRPGETVTIKYLRGGEEHSTIAALGTRSPPISAEQIVRVGRETTRRVLEPLLRE